MNQPRHVSTCISEWLDDYETKCPFNLPDALAAIRDELQPQTAPTEETKP